MGTGTRRVWCGGVAIGGGAPVSIQSMTNTDTRDVAATVAQIRRLAEAGCEIVRCAVPDAEAATAFGQIRRQVDLPLVADIHFDYRLALSAIGNGADKVRINPGNIGSEKRVRAVLAAAKARGIPVRIGVNSGSLEQSLLMKYGGVTAEALAESALLAVRRAEETGFEDIVVSLKASDAKLNFDAHRRIAEWTDHPLHIGITESGTVQSGKVKSAVGIGALLLAGIGDTMRVSLTGDPVEEVLFAKEILKAAGLRKSGIELVSCPTCGRTRVDLAAIANQVEEKIRAMEADWKAEGRPPITVAVMGCEVNGPGEARNADLGIAFGSGRCLLFEKGEIVDRLPPEEAAEALFRRLAAWGRP